MTTRVQWYVIKIMKVCPVVIASMYEDECEWLYIHKVAKEMFCASFGNC